MTKSSFRCCIAFLIICIIALILYFFLYRDSFTLHTNFKGPHRSNVDKILSNKATKILGNKNTPIYIIDNFVSPKETDLIISSVIDNLEPSTLTRPEKDDPYFRTSKTGHFNKGVPIQDKIEKKIANFLNLDNETAESCQVQHYEVGNEFKAHWDYFHKGVDDEHLKDGQRSWTFMLYLNNVKKGGATEFVNLKEIINPKKGTAVVWCSLDNNGNPDEDTLHRGTPVEEGYKFIITKWFLDK